MITHSLLCWTHLCRLLVNPPGSAHMLFIKGFSYCSPVSLDYLLDWPTRATSSFMMTDVHTMEMEMSPSPVKNGLPAMAAVEDNSSHKNGSIPTESTPHPSDPQQLTSGHQLSLPVDLIPTLSHATTKEQSQSNIKCYQAKRTHTHWSHSARTHHEPVPTEDTQSRHRIAASVGCSPCWTFNNFQHRWPNSSAVLP